MFLHVQSTQTLRMDSPCFFLTFFSLLNEDMYLLKKVSTFHLTNHGESGGPPISKISDQNLS